jgi:large subunit ribosomal protein L5
MPRMKDKYQEEIVPAMLKEFGYANVMQVPRLSKIVVNVGLGEALQNAKALERT